MIMTKFRVDQSLELSSTFPYTRGCSYPKGDRPFTFDKVTTFTLYIYIYIYIYR